MKDEISFSLSLDPIFFLLTLIDPTMASETLPVMESGNLDPATRHLST
jgi:hypothetical protein